MKKPIFSNAFVLDAIQAFSVVFLNFWSNCLADLKYTRQWTVALKVQVVNVRDNMPDKEWSFKIRSGNVSLSISEIY